MSEEKFYIKDLQLIREFCINSDREDVYKYIYSLQQENHQLKEEINEYKRLGYKHLQEKNNKLESVLDEIREIINQNISSNYDFTKAFYEIENILDKVE